MNKYIFFLFLLVSSSVFSQETIKEVLKKYNNESIPYIGVKRTSILKPEKVYILDARESREYKVSHIKNAIHVGYDKFDLEATKKKLTNKNAVIIVYCTLGVRSEDIAEKLKAAGYPNVFNLFGGIVEWKNEGKPVFNSKERKQIEFMFLAKNGSMANKGRKVY